MAILSIVLLASWQLYQQAIGGSLKSEKEVVAVNLARALMNEIVCKRFAEKGASINSSLGPESGESRNYIDEASAYDDVDDYVGWKEDWQNRDLQNEKGEIFDGRPASSGEALNPNYKLFNFTREVEEIKCIDVDHDGTDNGDLTRSAKAGSDTNSTDFKRIVVKVSCPGMRDIELVEIRANLD